MNGVKVAGGPNPHAAVNAKTTVMTVNGTSTTMPELFYRWVYDGNNDSEYMLKVGSFEEVSKVKVWLNNIGKDAIKRLESTFETEERKRFHLALIWLYDAEEALSIISYTTVCRLTKGVEGNELAKMVRTYQKEGQTLDQTLGVILDEYDRFVEAGKTANEIIEEAKQVQKETKTAEDNLNQRLAEWNIKRISDDEIRAHLAQLLDLRNTVDALVYQNSLVLELIKTLL